MSRHRKKNYCTFHTATILWTIKRHNHWTWSHKLSISIGSLMIGLWNRDQRAQPTHFKLRALHNANENLITKRELKFSILNENIYLYICKLSLYLVIHISITKFAQILLPTNLRSFLYFPSSKIIKSEILPTGMTIVYLQLT